VLADADRVILLEKGRITAEGAYGELVEEGILSGNPGEMKEGLPDKDQ